MMVFMFFNIILLKFPLFIIPNHFIIINFIIITITSIIITPNHYILIISTTF